jgi:hypothetical protein
VVRLRFLILIYDDGAGTMRFSTVFETLQNLGHDEDFEPTPNELFFPTMFGPGSGQKIDVLRQRVELGLPLWHPRDNPICSTAGVGADKQKQECTYGKTAKCFAARRNKMLGD